MYKSNQERIIIAVLTAHIALQSSHHFLRIIILKVSSSAERLVYCSIFYLYQNTLSLQVNQLHCYLHKLHNLAIPSGPYMRALIHVHTAHSMAYKSPGASVSFSTIKLNIIVLLTSINPSPTCFHTHCFPSNQITLFQSSTVHSLCFKAKASHFFLCTVVSSGFFFFITALNECFLRAFLIVWVEIGLRMIVLMCLVTWTAFAPFPVVICERMEWVTVAESVMFLHFIKVLTIYNRTLPKYIWYQRCSNMTGVSVMIKSIVAYLKKLPSHASVWQLLY